MTFVWLRVYPILEVLGVLFELDKSNVSRNVKFIMFDLGFIGLQNDRGDVEIILPLRKPKGREPSAEQTAYNRLVSRCRVMVENAIEIGYGQTNSYR
jgi:hypothetical protein